MTSPPLPRPDRRAFPAIPTMSHTLTVTPREPHLSGKQRWALEILAAAGLRGSTGATLLAHGFSVDMLEHFSIRLGVARVCEISFAFVFGNLFETRGDCFPKCVNGARLHFA